MKPLRSAARWQVGRVVDADRDVDQRGEHDHGHGQVRGDRLRRVAGLDGDLAQVGLEAREDDRRRGGQDDGATPVGPEGADPDAYDEEADDGRQRAMDPLDPGRRVVDGWQDLAVAERPVGAAESGTGDAHDAAPDHEHVGGDGGQQGQLLEARHGEADSTAAMARCDRPRRRDAASSR